MKKYHEPQIRISEGADIRAIKRWLEDEERRGVHGNFWCNVTIIEQAHQNGELRVFIDEALGEPVAFQVGGLVTPGILQVKSEYRGRGIGREMVNECVRRAKHERPLLYIQCKPSTSIPFWESVGFTILPPRDGRIHAWRTLPTRNELPADCEQQQVVVRFFPEQKKWGEAPVLEEYHPKAALLEGGSIALEDRVLFHERKYEDVRDAIVQIEVEGTMLYSDKAKYPPAARLGLCRCPNGWYLDEIFPEDSYSQPD